LANFDEWEKISENDVNLEGMDDPFKDRWKSIEKKYFLKSSMKDYNSYSLRPMIVKANDDLR
jgi:hypothetical protein